MKYISGKENIHDNDNYSYYHYDVYTDYEWSGCDGREEYEEFLETYVPGGD